MGPRPASEVSLWGRGEGCLTEVEERRESLSEMTEVKDHVVNSVA